MMSRKWKIFKADRENESNFKIYLYCSCMRNAEIYVYVIIPQFVIVNFEQWRKCIEFHVLSTSAFRIHKWESLFSNLPPAPTAKYPTAITTTLPMLWRSIASDSSSSSKRKMNMFFGTKSFDTFLQPHFIFAGRIKSKIFKFARTRFRLRVCEIIMIYEFIILCDFCSHH